ncbi:MAG TPA: hypothetical protein VI094_12095 [Propionibacteriaceae bacterium]
MHAFRPSLAISDGTTEAMAVHNLDPLDNSDIAIFNKILVRPLLSFGPAVASLDHVVKDRDGRGKYALGGVHKLSAVSRAGYMLVNREPFGIGLTGHSRLLITKDRPGQLRAHGLRSPGALDWYGDLVLESHGEDSATIKIWPAKERDQDAQDERPIEHMRRVAEAITERGSIKSKAQIEKAVEGKTDLIRDAIYWLIVDGYLPRKGPYAMLKPYPSEGEES